MRRKYDLTVDIYIDGPSQKCLEEVGLGDVDLRCQYLLLDIQLRYTGEEAYTRHSTVLLTMWSKECWHDNVMWSPSPPSLCIPACHQNWSNPDVAIASDTWAHSHLTHPQVAKIQHTVIHDGTWQPPISNAATTNVPYSYSYILTMYSQCQIAVPFMRTPLKNTDTEAFRHLVWIICKLLK